MVLVGQFPIGQSKQTKSELTRNIIKVDKEPKTKKHIPTQPTQTQQRIRNAEEFYFEDKAKQMYIMEISGSLVLLM